MDDTLAEIRWRVNAIREDLQGHAYGLDEWSSPVVNLRLVVEYIDKKSSHPTTEGEKGGDV